MIVTPRSHHIAVPSAQGWKKLAYLEWGNQDQQEIVICVHGLTRNARDFDDLARALASDFRVIVPDMLGRGKSDWLDHGADYSYTRYCADAAILIARAGVERVHWVGTSMGGIIGMMLDASPRAPIKSLVLNDVGAKIPAASLRDLAAYVGADPRFQNLSEAADYFSQVHAPFGHLPRSYWERMAMHSVRWEDPVYRPHYDPSIAEVFNQAIFDIDLSAFWPGNATPSLILRGAESGLLLDSTVKEMMAVRPGTDTWTVPGCGHAPSLAEPEQVEVIRAFLMAHRG